MKPAILLIFLFLLAVPGLGELPPAMFDFQQFYGSVSGISATGYKIRAQVSSAQFETSLAANGQYGYSPTFKVTGQNGQQINFYVIAPSGAATAIGSPATYQNRATTRLDFTYNAPSQQQQQPPPATVCGNNIREGSEACDGTDLTGQTCASQVGTGSTGALNCTSSCTFNTTQCTAALTNCWQCNDWGQCRNNNQTRTCARVDCTVPDVLRVEPAQQRFCESNQTTSSTSGGLSICTMSWECGAWSLCRNSQQTRICFRVDNCATLQVQNPGITITSTPQPSEEQSCQEGTTTAPQQLCSPGLKRCLGSQLQLCSADGLQWATLQTCPGSCDQISLSCRTEPAVSPSPTQKPSSTWIYLLAGSVVLVLVIVGLSMVLLNKKKYAPAKEYIQESRARGIDDEQIREKLVDEGWDERGVGKLFK